jgi:hypothetical protein
VNIFRNRFRHRKYLLCSNKQVPFFNSPDINQ